MPATTALRLSGRDALALLHRTTTNALADLAPGQARATLFCDFRGRLLHRVVVALTRDGSLWLLRADAPGAELAAAIERTIFRDDVRIEDRSADLPVAWVLAGPGESPGLDEADGVPRSVLPGDGTALLVGGAPPAAQGGRGALDEAERIARLLPRHGHEIAETFHPFEVGLAREVHLAKGCFTGQEALQRLITYDSVRRRPALVRLEAGVTTVPVEILAGGERAGVLTSVASAEGFAVLRREWLDADARLGLADGSGVRIVSAPDLARPLGRP